MGLTRRWFTISSRRLEGLTYEEGLLSHSLLQWGRKGFGELPSSNTMREIVGVALASVLFASKRMKKTTRIGCIGFPVAIADFSER